MNWTVYLSVYLFGSSGPQKTVDPRRRRRRSCRLCTTMAIGNSLMQIVLMANNEAQKTAHWLAASRFRTCCKNNFFFFLLKNLCSCRWCDAKVPILVVLVVLQNIHTFKIIFQVLFRCVFFIYLLQLLTTKVALSSLVLSSLFSCL